MRLLITLGLAATVGWLMPNALAQGGYTRAEAILPIGVGNEVVNEDGQNGEMMDDDDLLYNKQLCPGAGLHDEFDMMNPVFAPDGHQLTWGEYNQVEGVASLRCGPRGTHVVIHLSGLVPKGVYTIWVFVFDADGAMIGAGALGVPDGSQSDFTASASGRGTITAHHPAGALSALPLEVGCLLDEVEVHLVVAYHLDGQTYGPVPAPIGPPAGGCYWVPHAAFTF